MQRADAIVFIGRFQPFHKAHKKIIDNALEQTDKVIVLIGSYNQPITPKNPFPYVERMQMIRACYSTEDNAKLEIEPLRDYLYNDIHWISSVQNIVAKYVEPEENVKIIGHFKDDSSYYLNFFGNWELIQEPNYFNGLNATDIRRRFFLKNSPLNITVPKEVSEILNGKKKYNQEWFNNIRESMEYIENYKAKWKNLPYPPTFVTTDAVVTKAGHVLVVKRGVNPGKGMYALPGGFLGQNENHFDSCIRELYEETKIDLPRTVIENACVDKEGKKFDHPKRDPRGRTITTAYHFDLTEKKTSLSPLPKVKGSDDAEDALWMPFNDIIQNEDKFFNDHLHIIQHFIGGVK